MKKTIALIGALDTKGTEYQFLKEQIEAQGFTTFVIDIGVLDKPLFPADITRAQIAEAGGQDINELVRKKDRGEAVKVMSKGAQRILPELYELGKFDGVIALGGTGGTSLACAAMRTLPLGVPKVMVSTVAGTDVSDYVGVKDIVMIPSIVDVSGINRISREVFTKAAGAICGMLSVTTEKSADKPTIVASMFGNTTEAVEMAKTVLEQHGYEVLVFHCTGQGGKTMESLIDAGMVEGVLDMTTTEIADDLAGGVFSAGPDRLGAASRRGIPAIVVPGCLDMVNFGARGTVPTQYKERLLYQHNENVTLMRTNVEENKAMGKQFATQLNQSKAPVTVLLPLKGISVISAPEGAFYQPEADQALFESIKQHLRSDIAVIEMDHNINDQEFAKRCAEQLLQNIQLGKSE